MIAVSLDLQWTPDLNCRRILLATCMRSVSVEGKLRVVRTVWLCMCVLLVRCIASIEDAGLVLEGIVQAPCALSAVVSYVTLTLPQPNREQRVVIWPRSL